MFVQQKLVMKPQTSINKLAYSKAIFHCLKFPSSNVIGVFIGTGNEVIDAFPLFHSPVVSPSLEIAFGLVESQLKQGTSIVGVYSSAVNCQAAIGDLSLKIAETIKKSSGVQPSIMNIFVDDESEVKKLSYNLYLGIDKEKVTLQPHQFSSLQKQITDGQHRRIIDVDSHFQNIELDFTNSYLNK